MKRILSSLFHSKLGKLLPVLIIAGLVATASSTVYVFYYGNATATVQTPDVRLVAGTDAPGSSCSVYPCAAETVSSTYDTATIGISFFPATAGSPTPATYYTNITTIRNYGSSIHTIDKITIFNIGGTIADLGSITVWYCTTQTEFTPGGTLVTPGNCVGSFSITSGTGGSLTGFSQTLAASTTAYIEMVAYAASGASPSTTVTFQMAVQWV